MGQVPPPREIGAAPLLIGAGEPDHDRSASRRNTAGSPVGRSSAIRSGPKAETAAPWSQADAQATSNGASPCVSRSYHGPRWLCGRTKHRSGSTIESTRHVDRADRGTVLDDRLDHRQRGAVDPAHCRSGRSGSFDQVEAEPTTGDAGTIDRAHLVRRQQHPGRWSIVGSWAQSSRKITRRRIRTRRRGGRALCRRARRPWLR